MKRGHKHQGLIYYKGEKSRTIRGCHQVTKSPPRTRFPLSVLNLSSSRRRRAHSYCWASICFRTFDYHFKPATQALFFVLVAGSRAAHRIIVVRHCLKKQLDVNFFFIGAVHVAIPQCHVFVVSHIISCPRARCILYASSYPNLQCF